MPFGDGASSVGRWPRPADLVRLDLRRWIPAHKAASNARLRVLCFPYAGAGAAAFRGWQDGVPRGVEILPVHLPARESRWHEPPITDLIMLARLLTIVLRPLLEAPYALFGHSMGGLIAFELARQLRRANRCGPVHVFVSGTRAPHVPDRELPLHGLPDDVFLQQLAARAGGTAAEAFHNIELARALLPTLRADFRMCETYHPMFEEPLDVPITLYGGRRDPLVTATDLLGWNIHTRSAFTLRLFAGDHFFLNQGRAAFLRAFAVDLAAISTGDALPAS